MVPPWTQNSDGAQHSMLTRVRGKIVPMKRSIALLLLVALAALAAIYLRDIGSAYDRISRGSEVVDSPSGAIEFRQGGAGAPVLVIHGSGGGFDQGELIAKAVLGDEFRWIAPSRFGYLGSALPSDATFDEQARAYAVLLDALQIDRVSVVALSHGGPSALLFAVLHPERVSSLVLISCGVASSSDEDQSAANRKGDSLTTVFSYDPLYWMTSRFFRRQLMQLMGADRDVIANLEPEQRELVDRLIEFMNPVEPRSLGVAFDNGAAMPNERIRAIVAPTLIFHATDDTLQLYRNAEYAAAAIPDARLQRFERGGHLLFAVERTAIRQATQQFIRVNDETALSR